jgi:hypothetical protein
MNINWLSVADNVVYCCGVSEVYGITAVPRESLSPHEVMKHICSVHFFKKKRGVYLFEDVDVPIRGPRRFGQRVRKIGDYIKEQGLGRAVLIPSTTNPNTLNKITLLVWLVDEPGLSKWWGEHEPKVSENDWAISQRTIRTLGGANVDSVTTVRRRV